MMVLCTHLLPYFGYLDECCLLMQRLCTSSHNFWRDYHKVLLSEVIIPKRKIFVKPMTEFRRIKLIKLQKLYNFLDIEFDIGLDSNEITLFQYYLFFLTNQALTGRRFSNYPNFSKVLIAKGKIYSINF